MKKHFVSAESLLKDSFELGLRVFESGYRPTFIIGVWRGGAPVGIAVQEILDMLNCPTDHFSIRTSSYDGAMRQATDVKIMGLQHVVDTIEAKDQLLIIDDIFDTGRSVDAIIGELEERCRLNMPTDICVATVYFKPKRNQTSRIPDFYVHVTDDWTVFPHELQGCLEHEIRRNKNMPKRFYDFLSQREPQEE